MSCKILGLDEELLNIFENPDYQHLIYVLLCFFVYQIPLVQVAAKPTTAAPGFYPPRNFSWTLPAAPRSWQKVSKREKIG